MRIQLNHYTKYSLPNMKYCSIIISVCSLIQIATTNFVVNELANADKTCLKELNIDRKVAVDYFQDFTSAIVPETIKMMDCYLREVHGLTAENKIDVNKLDKTITEFVNSLPNSDFTINQKNRLPNAYKNCVMLNGDNIGVIGLTYMNCIMSYLKSN